MDIIRGQSVTQGSTHLSVQVNKKVKFSWRDNSLLAVKGLIYYVNFPNSLFHFYIVKLINRRGYKKKMNLHKILSNISPIFHNVSPIFHNVSPIFHNVSPILKNPRLINVIWQKEKTSNFRSISDHFILREKWIIKLMLECL